ncbi:MAG: hypothetical protein A2017_17210 [Lentisphaerae bacterium GWF2_44_16]|nr:MAG: hypothetical protein A2017_17210 [Lentisphaerae bacterium GWF2_44_16]
MEQEKRKRWKSVRSLKSLNAHSKNNWTAKWIGLPEATIHTSSPSPYFRKIFTCNKKFAGAKVYVCGLGYYELYLNGRKVGEHVLDPVVTCYDKRIRYVVYDVTEYLVAGKNVIGVILGNGWYNHNTADNWNFEKASWRSVPKLLLQIEVNGKNILESEQSWKTATGPIVFNAFRNGEFYDARLEFGNWLSYEYDDSGWKHASLVSPPGGVLEPQIMPACKVMQTMPAVKFWNLPGGEIIYDINQSVAGWARISVSGEAGALVTVKYSDILDEDTGDISIEGLVHIHSGEFQTDRYTLKGSGTEIWEPRFTYHGFRYVKIITSGNVCVHSVEARVVHTAFKPTGNFSSSNEVVNRLQECTRWSYIGNFVGIPTDCPHREKNGWTGDAQLAVETGLFNFDVASSYKQWLDNFKDTQRPSGQLPGIVPSCGWGYNWGNGPAWDSAFILIPWYIYLYTGDASAIETHYDGMARYIDYCTYMADEHIVSFGLGDWCHVEPKRKVSSAFTSTAYYYTDCLLLARFAEMMDMKYDYDKYSRLASEIKKAFNKTFYKGDGIYANGEITALGSALYHGITASSEKPKVLAKLINAIESNNFRTDFGVLGAKYVPRVLSENGYAEHAYRMILQPDFPGWVNWLSRGATTLWEMWDGTASRNHIMFGDISAWMFQYLAGIAPDPAMPGFKHIIIHPHPVTGLEWVKAEHISRYGKIKITWRKNINNFNLEVQIPYSSTATVTLPDASTEVVKGGRHCFNVELKSANRKI